MELWIGLLGAVIGGLLVVVGNIVRRRCHLTIHLYHGLWSLFQTLGVTSPWLPTQTRRRIAIATAAIIGAGYANIPLAVLTSILNHA